MAGVVIRVRLLCDAGGPCDFHRDRAADPGTVASVPTPKCPWYCDADGCARQAELEGLDGRMYCPRHAAAGLLTDAAAGP
jgi:hypothetical protein